MAATQDGTRSFSFRAFGQGIAVAALLYALAAAWVFLNAGKMAEDLSGRLASQTVVLEWGSPFSETGPPLAEKMGPFQEIPVLPEPAHAEPEHAAAPEHAEPAHPKNVTIMESGLAQAPIEGLFEETDQGRMPKARAKDGLTPFKGYRRSFDLYASNAPLVSIAIVGLGLSDVATESAVRTMPPEISLVISPYAAAVDFWITESRARGHEVWLTLPMESKSYPQHDTGPHTMLIGAPERENRTKMDWLMTCGAGYVGFVTSYNPDFMKSVGDMRPVVGNVYNRGLAFVDGSAEPGTTPQTMASAMKAPYSNIDVWIDAPDASEEVIKESLKRLEEIARDKGVAVGVIQALPVSYQQILTWTESLSGKGLRLAPLSAATGF